VLGLREAKKRSGLAFYMRVSLWGACLPLLCFFGFVLVRWACVARAVKKFFTFKNQLIKTSLSLLLSCRMPGKDKGFCVGFE
jgi:hypothetical protein